MARDQDRESVREKAARRLRDQLPFGRRDRDDYCARCDSSPCTCETEPRDQAEHTKGTRHTGTP